MNLNINITAVFFLFALMLNTGSLVYSQNQQKPVVVAESENPTMTHTRTGHEKALVLDVSRINQKETLESIVITSVKTGEKFRIDVSDGQPLEIPISFLDGEYYSVIFYFGDTEINKRLVIKS